MISSKYSDKSLSVLLALSAAAWGLYWWPLRTIEDLGIAGTWSVVVFNACPLIVLCPLLLFNFRTLRGVFWPAVLAGVMIGLAFAFYANGLVETTVARAVLLFYLTPVWSTILGVLWLSERLTVARVVSLVVAFVGLFLILSDSGSSPVPVNIGDLYGFLSGVFWAVALATLKRWSTIPILPLTALVFISTTLISMFFAVVVNVEPVPDLALIKAAIPTAVIWSVIILLPCFCVIFRLSQLLFPGRVTILMMLEVVVAVVSAAILLPEETFLPLQWVGAAAIVLAGLVEVLFGYAQSRVKAG